LLDKAGAKVKTLDEAVFAELDRALREMQASPPRALAVRSAKDAGFAAGADLRMLAGMTDEAATRPRLKTAHAIVDRLEGLPFPTIAVTHGHCMGGGLELALACDYRLARSDATFPLPEVRVGLHPASAAPHGSRGRSTHRGDEAHAHREVDRRAQSAKNWTWIIRW
jgi:3-hydroxyacyl-CoA dehydrogenase / enoyl-CoA hydratase / 3-hydroxybutyryl-CoA epimerase